MEDPQNTLFACMRYERFWQTREDEIKVAFHKHTGLAFQQDEITVIAHDDISYSGSETKPMRLNSDLEEDWRCGAELMHELGHRLLGGNGLDEDDVPELNASSHSLLFLFLYDVWQDIIGKEAADKKVSLENRTEEYQKVWGWALGKTYQERQTLLKQVIDRQHE